jgi:hypothetical protein
LSRCFVGISLRAPLGGVVYSLVVVVTIVGFDVAVDFRFACAA